MCVVVCVGCVYIVYGVCICYMWGEVCGGGCMCQCGGGYVGGYVLHIHIHMGAHVYIYAETRGSLRMFSSVALHLMF